MGQYDDETLTVDAPGDPAAATEDVFVFPASFAQQRLWFLDQMDPGNTVYNGPSALRLQGPLDVGAVEQSLNEIVRRHEALRTTFESAHGRPVQIILPAQEVRLPVVDLSALEENAREARVRQEATAEGRRSFDLARGPLLRLKLLKLGDEEHVLLMTTHHIVADGLSQNVLRQELATLYEAYRDGRPSPLPELPIQYADYAVWQHELLSGPELENQLAYWKQQLADAPAALALPTDHPRPAIQSHRGAHLQVRISPHLTAQLRKLCWGEDVTLFMALLAAYQVLLYRYSGETEVVVGMPIANRTQAETEALIGFFVNTLALHTSLAGDPSWRELLARVREATLGAIAHQGLPFEKLVEELQPVREMSHHPLFQVTFTFQNAAPKEIVELRGLRLSTITTEADTVIADLSLVLTETTEELYGGINYSTDLFNATTIKSMAVHYERLLWAMVQEPGQQITVAPMLSEAERHQLLSEWNQTSLLLTPGLCPHQLFERQVQRAPDALALADTATRLSYRELNERANQLAHLLRQRGLRPDSTVAVLLPRSPDLIIAALAVLKAGGAYLPLDASYPTARLSFILEHGIACLLTTEDLAGPLPATGGPATICLDQDWQLIAEQSTMDLPAAVLPDNLAYVIYTSGSTGEPQGIEISHRSLLNLVCWHGQAFAVTAADRATQLASSGFDASVWEVWPYLAAGASLHFVPDEVRLDAGRLRDWLIDREITISFLPTPLAEQALQLDWMDAASLRVLLTGGDQLHQWASGNTSFVLVNNYGPSEATVVATSGKVREEGSERTTTWPAIGRPIANTRVYVVDAELELVAVGVVGELCISGEGLARGYVGAADRTAARFMPDPYAGDNRGQRMYRTGDWGRYRPDGEIEFVGRLDNQVKVRGFRIELGEVEAALREQHGVKEAVVIASDDLQKGKRLVAYLVAQGEMTLSVSEIQDELKRRLPDYMVPVVFMVLAELPLTPRGKVDRRALPAADQLTARSEVEFVGPRTVAEEVVAEIWRETLGLQRVGVHDNFFELGGHSLMATQVLAQIQAVFRVDVPIHDLFQSPTVENLVEVIGQVWGQREIVEEIARTFKHVSSLSAEQVDQTLAESD